MGHYQVSSNNSLGVKFDTVPGGHKFYMGLYRENFRNLPVPSHKAWAYWILHVALTSKLLPRVSKL